MQSGSITPPPTPPRVAFDPPLFLQRRTAVFDVLTKVHQHPRFQGKLKSLLDVGCGEECLLVSSLIAQNDELPLEQVTGIDIDDAILDPTLIESLGPNGLHVTDEGRWRKFGLTMLHGTFEQLSLQNLAHHDIIVSAEVIEHLDPGPLSNFAPVLLGRLRPRVCVVTTPNRDFNDLFSLPFTPEVSDVQESAQSSVIGLGEVVDPINLPPPQATVLPTPSAHEQAWRALSPGDVCSSGDRYWRAGVPYGMRHPDHRFEWTRQEFRDWALKAAEDFGYDVTFSGVGGLGNGMCVVGSTGWAVGDALARGCGYDSTGENSPDQKDEGVLTKANEVWGDCSQIAIFTIKEDEEEGSADYVNMLDWSKQNPTEPNTTTSISPLNPIFFPNPITQIAHHDFPYETDEIFPPSYVTVMELLEKELANYLPNKIREQWSKSSMEIMQEEFRGKTHNHNEDYLYESDSECDYNWNPEVDGDEAARLLRKKERRYEKGIRNEIERSILAGKQPELIKVVKVTGVTLKQLWQSSVGGKKGLRRLCRFREDVFKDIMMKGWKVQVGADLVGDKADGGSFCKSIIDTTGSNKDIGTGGEFKGQSLAIGRQMSFSRPAGAVGTEFASITSNPVKAGQQLYSPSCSASRHRHKSLLIETPLNSSSPLQPIEKLPDPVLSSHIFTSFDCPSSTSFEELKVSEENATPSEVISRPRSCSMPPSPTIPHATATDPPTDPIPPSPSRLPFNRSQSADQVPSSSPKPSGPQELPLQLESDTNMVVKIFSVSATRSVIDLIRRDLTEQDKEVLKLWRVVKVEFNAQSIEPSPPGVVEREPVVTPGRVHWHDDSVDPFSNDPLGSDEDWESSPMPPPFGDIHNGDEWDSWHIDFSPPDIVLDFPTPDEPLENAFDNMSIASHQSLPYSVDEFGTAADAEASPWAGNPALEATAHKYHTELIYPLNTVNTLLSIDKGKPREKEPLQADLKGFLIAYKALESNDQGFLNVDWKEYIKSKERVGRWMEERRRAVQDYKESERIMLAAGFKPDAIPARKALCSWPDWLAKVEKQEAEDGVADDSAEELFAGVVVFRPFGKGGVEEGMPGEKRDHVTMPPFYGGGRKPQALGATDMPLNMPDEFAGWSGF